MAAWLYRWRVGAPRGQRLVRWSCMPSSAARWLRASCRDLCHVILCAYCIFAVGVCVGRKARATIFFACFHFFFELTRSTMIASDQCTARRPGAGARQFMASGATAAGRRTERLGDDCNLYANPLGEKDAHAAACGLRIGGMP